ncbi:MAG: glycoside hydrolase family 19 protein, partial [Patescibacteria group bacterium]
NCVYANRIGNGNETSGDGWRYCGRGIIQITGKDNYKTCGIGLGLDLISSPELLEQPANAFRSGAWFWKSHNLNSLADKGDFLGITRIINGGTIGQEDRERYYIHAKIALGIS